jgi:hypothetical protein
MNYKVVFGATQFNPVWALLTSVLSRIKNPSIWILRTETCEALDYKPTDESLGTLRVWLETKQVCSLQIQQNDPELIIIGLYAPRFCDESLNQWKCIVECPETFAQQTYRLSKERDEISFISLSVDEIPSFDDAEVTRDTYPWGEWCLILGAVRRADGTWDEREGPTAQP